MFCEKCEDFWKTVLSNAEIPDTLTANSDIRYAPHKTVLHTCMRDLKHSYVLQCILCRSISASPTEFEMVELLKDEDAKLNVVVEFDTDRGPKPVLSVSFIEPGEDGFEDKVRIPKRMLALCSGLLEEEDLSTTLERAMHLDNSTTGSDAAMELASYWLTRCLTSHEKCNIKRGATEATFIPTRVVDVGNSHDEIRLVETAKLQGDADRRFVALSHCWGTTQIITTRDDNYEQHLQRINPVELSKTFSEAIHTTRKLGYRYLWIDSLCIKQGNAQDWEVEAATMCDVYRFADFTIVAAHASGGEVGCFRERDGITHFPFFVEIPGTKAEKIDAAATKARILFDSYGRTKGGFGVEPPIYGRAWVLQEQLLSPRMLIFDGPQIRWECVCSHGSERSPRGGMSRHAGHMKAIRMGVLDDVDFFTEMEKGRALDPDPLHRNIRHQYWLNVIMNYTHRGMTAKSDRVVALDGIARALSQKTDEEYVAGLWKGYLRTGLLWGIPHYKEYTPTVEDAFDFDDPRNSLVRHKEPVAPSWSWMSVTLPVTYTIPALVPIPGICTVLDVKVTGTPAKEEGTIKISGHVRKGYVNSIYPYAIREAAKECPSMTFCNRSGRRDYFTFRGRNFPPSEYFIFSPTKPSGKDVLNSSDWRLVRGQWRPDQILDPNTEITFVAIAQDRRGVKEGTLSHRRTDQDPLHVFALGLVPTGRAKDEYTRVGYAEWEHCSWYGYKCGYKNFVGNGNVEKMEGWRGVFSKDLSYGVKQRDGEHAHAFEHDELPDLKKYHKSVCVEETVLAIV